MRHSVQKLLLVGGVIALVAVTGCVQASVNADVGADGMIDRYKMNVTMSGDVHQRLESRASSQGYDSVGPYLVRDLNDSAIGSKSFATNRHGDQVSTIVTLSNVDPAGVEQVSTTKENGTLTYVDRTFKTSSRVSSISSVHYTLEMPGEITEASTNDVEGSTAEWHLDEGEIAGTVIRAKSEVSGIGPLAIIVGLVLVGGVVGGGALAGGAVLYTQVLD
ncbi:MAG: hypothetical protein ABEJ86_04305 [Halococcoides sp.]